jgi:hypothetical protein
MKSTMNAYVAVLIVTIFSSGITMIIVDAGTTKVIKDAMSESLANHTALQQTVASYRNSRY